MGTVITRNSRTDRLGVFVLGGKVGHVTRHERQLFKVKRSKVQVTKSREVSADKNTITRQCMVISTSNLVEIIDVGVDVCGILSRSVGQTNRKKEYGGHSAYNMQKLTENVAKSLKFCTLKGNRGRCMRCLNLHRKFTNNRFCACAVQMLLKMVANATICSTFEVQCGIPTSTRTTAIRHFRATLTERVISRMRTN